MPVEATLDLAFETLLAKSRSDLGGVVAAPVGGGSGGGVAATSPRTATVNFEWAGGGSALVAASTDPILIEVPFASELVWVHLFAGSASGAPVVVTATLDLQLTRWASFGGTTPLYGSGLSPRITADALANMSLSGWFANLTAGDVLIARLLTFSGAATWLTLNLFLRSSEVPIGITGVSDGAGGQVVDASGNRVVWRS